MGWTEGAALFNRGHGQLTPSGNRRSPWTRLKPVARVPTVEHREPCESRGSRTVLERPGVRFLRATRHSRRFGHARLESALPHAARIWVVLAIVLFFLCLKRMWWWDKWIPIHYRISTLLDTIVKGQREQKQNSCGDAF